MASKGRGWDERVTKIGVWIVLTVNLILLTERHGGRWVPPRPWYIQCAPASHSESISLQGAGHPTAEVSTFPGLTHPLRILQRPRQPLAICIRALLALSCSPLNDHARTWLPILHHRMFCAAIVLILRLEDVLTLSLVVRGVL